MIAVVMFEMLGTAVFGVAMALAAPVSDDYGAMWDKCQGAIGAMYYARVERKAEMDTLFAKYAPQAKAAKSREEFSGLMDQMIEDFTDSHFAFLPDTSQGYYMFDALARRDPVPMPQIGAWFKPAGDGYTVTMVLDGLEAQKAGLRKGDELLTIDGKKFTPIESIRAALDKTVRITYRRGGKVSDAEVAPSTQSALGMFLESTRNSARVIERGSKKIGYVHLWTMASDDFRNTLHGLVYGKLRETDGFILDLRDGFGGRPEGFGDPFFRPEATLEWKPGPSIGMKQLFGYQRPLVVLTNGGSRSAKEVFSAIMKKSKRATLIGSTTAGHVLGTSPYRVSDWAYLEIPMVDVILDGERIEDKGVSPDIEVPAEFDAAGKDLYIEAALKHLDHVFATSTVKR